MTEPAAVTEYVESQADIIERHLIAERTGKDRRHLSVVELAVLHKAALALASDASDPKDVTALLALAPSVIRPGAKPEPRLKDVCAPDAPWDLSRLSMEMLDQLTVITAVATGAAEPIASPRRESALLLALKLDAGETDVIAVRGLISSILAGSSLTLDSIAPSDQAQLIEQRHAIAGLEEKVARLERELEVARRPLPQNVASLAAERAAREAPTISSLPALR